VHPHSKGVRVLSLHSPIDVKGPSARRRQRRKGPLLARAAGAIGLAVVAAPAAALVPLTSTNLGAPDSRCEELLKVAQKTPAEKATRK
jgi:hypothetical protein